MADRDRDERGALAVGGCAERAQQRESLEVDAGERDAGLPAGADVALDQLAVGDDEQDALDALPFRVDGLVEDAVVEHGFVERDRQCLLRAELHGVRELLLLGDADDVDDPDADAVARDAEPHALLRQLVLGEERLQRVAERLRVAELAADDDAGRKRLARDLLQLGDAVVRDAGGSELRGADLQPDEALRLVAALLPPP